MNKKDKLQQELEGPGPKSIQCLNTIGIYTKSDLQQLGAINVFVKLKRECKEMKPSLNLLYGLVGLVEEIDWRDVARKEKGRLLMELESHKELEAILQNKSEREK